MLPKLECITHRSFEQGVDCCLRGYDDRWKLYRPVPHGLGAFVEVCGKVCSARFGEERLTECAFISCGHLEIEVVTGRPAVETECAGHHISEQLFVGMIMRPSHWNHTRGHIRMAQEAQGQKAARDASGYQHTWPLHSQNNPEPHEQRSGPDSV